MMMSKTPVIVRLIMCMVIGIVGCAAVPYNTVMQVSTIDALLAGAYEGQMTCKQLISYGDFGIGTFDALEGEMVLVEGKFYQVKADGKAYTPAMDLTTPFATVTRFNPDSTQSIPTETDISGLEHIVNRIIPNMNIFCAIKVKGRFLRVKTRSVPAQNKPYPPLTEVTKNQPIFNLEDISGTIVGFRCPSYIKGINVPGYHLHFISKDFASGGHVLGFSLVEGTIEIDACNRFLMILPEDKGSFDEIDLSRDRSADLEKVEQ